MALQDIVIKDSIDRSVTVTIVDSGTGTPETGVVWNTAGIDLWYRQEGGALVSITEATLANLVAAHTNGGFLHISDGVYRLDLPNAAFATGAEHVDYGGTVTGMIVIGGRVRLVDTDIESVDVMTVATTEPTGVPSATETPLEQINRLHQLMRNRLDATSGTVTAYDNADSALWKKIVTDAGGTYSEAKTSAP